MGELLRFLGRDHHIDAFTLWMPSHCACLHTVHAFTLCMPGGGLKRGHSHDFTDELSYEPVQNDVHVTLMGIFWATTTSV